MQKPRIILIETSTSLCSTALIEGSDTISYKESTELRAQAAMTAPFVKEMLDAKGLKVTDCDAVCVSKGPGSYTGLRVGVSTAKGLCFGAGIPLIAISTLETLVWQALEEGLIPEGCDTVIPMIDARRMEVYTAVYKVRDGKVTRMTEIAPVIVDENSFSAELAAGKVLFIGDGALKCKPVIGGKGECAGGCVGGTDGCAGGAGSAGEAAGCAGETAECAGGADECTGGTAECAGGAGNASFVEAFPKASAMKKAAVAAFESGDFEDVAYFEPFYLKQFVATVSRKNLF